MNFSTEEKEKYTLVTIKSDKLGGVISPELKALFVKLNSEGVRNIALDLSMARYCDSSGLSAILVGNRLCKNANGTFVMFGLTDMVTKLINISQLTTVLNITPTLVEAQDFLYMEEVGKELEND